MARPKPRQRSRAESGPVASFGNFVAQRRRTLELTQLDLADLAEVGVSSVRKLEAGQLSPTLAITVRILDALGLTLVTMPQADAETISGDTAELRVAEDDHQ
ncbi:helix-turn-helix domain-containing protein [Nocardia wallacei]|uniref:helix-turn-helix domain-containing protein n=1 Tax=Nocardia wallacei TaxID=480035 RepID=UPI002453A597|nr:helix-turn-helix domain-containing protein [Nocardia wallacei]